jgi:hypothetical protein
MKGSAVSFPMVLVRLLLTFTLEELLIDFQELVGQHSGENMAAVVWSTLETYDIQDKVCSNDISLFVSLN